MPIVLQSEVKQEEMEDLLNRLGLRSCPYRGVAEEEAGEVAFDRSC